MTNNDTRARALSGWCTTGHHRASETSVGCRGEFDASVCICPCHDPKHAHDPRFEPPAPREAPADLA